MKNYFFKGIMTYKKTTLTKKERLKKERKILKRLKLENLYYKDKHWKRILNIYQKRLKHFQVRMRDY